MSHYSQMSSAELEREIAMLKKQEEQSLKNGNQSAYEVYRQKRLLATSYLIDPEQIKLLHWYDVEGEDHSFFIHFINGVMAWGNWENNDQLQAIPIARLKLDRSSIV